MATDELTPEIREAMLSALKDWETRPRGAFDWFDDRCARHDWHYAIHVAWVGAWNREGRQTPVAQFIRAWLTEANILAALKADNAC